MTDVKKLRETLAEADRQRAIERSAETARGLVRLGHRPVARRRLITFLGRADRADWEFTRDETAAIYDALVTVREDARKRADELERQIAGDAS